MQVILKEDVVNLGYKDDIVTVKDGYGRNFLIPQGKAVIASESAKKVLAENLRQRAHKIAQIKKEAEEKEAQEKQTEIEKLVKKYEERVTELSKKEKEKELEKRKEDSSLNIGEKFVEMTSTHYENEYFIVDVPEKWSGKWSISKTVDTKNLGTPSQPAITYAFSRAGDNPMFGGGGQTFHVFPNGLSNKANNIKEWTKLGSNIYVGVGASSGFFNERNESYYKDEMARIKAK